MSRNKTTGKKVKLSSANKTAKPAPRWADLKKFGLARARFRSIKRFRSRHWKATKIKI